LECRLVGLKQMESGQVEECPIEYLLLLKGSQTIPSKMSYFAASAHRLREIAKNYTIENIAKSVVEQKRQALVEALPERENFIKRGYDYQEAELLAKRTKLRDKSNNGNAAAKAELTKIKDRQHRLLERREEVLVPLRREPELIVPDEVIFLAHALVVPSSDPEDRKRHDEAVEAMAVKVAWDYEVAGGATVKDVSTPVQSIAAGLAKYPGFDLLSIHPGKQERAIEVKGRAGVGDVELTENEWVKACNLRERYWLYVVFDCASPHPRLLRIQDPFGKLIVRAKGSVIINEQELFLAAEGN
jgi:hypothetical protein